MRPLNLIPPEDRRGDSAPLRAGILSYAVVGVLALALVGVVAYVLVSNDINDTTSEIASLEARQATAQATADGLSPYTDFATLSQTRNLTVQTLARSRFDWERVLREMALVIPTDVTLQSLDATASGASATGTAAPTDAAATAGPSLAITGCAKGQEGVAEFLAALKDIDGVTRVGMQSSALGAVGTDSAAAPSDDEGTVCPSSSEVAQFQITVTFDAVPVVAAAAPATTTPAATGTATTPAPAPTTDDGGVAATESTQDEAQGSAESQVNRARNGGGEAQ